MATTQTTQKDSRGSFNSNTDAINKETIKKEMRHFRIHDSYVLPKMRKSWVLTEKPNNIVLSKIISDGINDVKTAPDDHATQWRTPFSPDTGPPKVKASQDYGWYPKPLIWEKNALFNHPRIVTEITLLYGPKGQSRQESGAQK